MKYHILYLIKQNTYYDEIKMSKVYRYLHGVAQLYFQKCNDNFFR